MPTETMKGAPAMERKIVSISSKRQITIPQKFFALLGFADEAECVVRGNELVIRPARNTSGGEFAELILEDLVKKGLSGEELIAQFKATQAKIRPAVEAMMNDAEKIANGTGEYSAYDDIFGTED